MSIQRRLKKLTPVLSFCSFLSFFRCQPVLVSSFRNAWKRAKDPPEARPKPRRETRRPSTGWTPSTECAHAHRERGNVFLVNGGGDLKINEAASSHRDRRPGIRDRSSPKQGRRDARDIRDTNGIPPVRRFYAFIATNGRSFRLLLGRVHRAAS